MNKALEQQLQKTDAIMETHGETQPEGETPPSEIQLIWDNDLCGQNTPLPPALIEGYIHRGEVSLLAGASKAGKSWMALQMAKCIGGGIKFLDHKTEQGTCVYVNTEIAAPFWEQRSRELNDKLGLKNAPHILHASTRGQEITINNVIPLLTRALKNQKLKTVDFICVDPYYTLTAGVDENAAGEVAKVMLEFQKMAEAMKAGVLITHHFTKGNAAGKTMLDRASGSGVFARSVDNFFTLTENSNGKMVLETTRRNAASPPPLEVKFNYPIWEAVGEAEAVASNKRGRPTGYDPELFVNAIPYPDRTIDERELRRGVDAPSPATYSRWKRQAIDDGVIEQHGTLYCLGEKYRKQKKPEPEAEPPKTGF